MIDEQCIRVAHSQIPLKAAAGPSEDSFELTSLVYMSMNGTSGTYSVLMMQ